MFSRLTNVLEVELWIKSAQPRMTLKACTLLCTTTTSAPDLPYKLMIASAEPGTYKCSLTSGMTNSSGTGMTNFGCVDTGLVISTKYGVW